jgi:hypothetical protein
VDHSLPIAELPQWVIDKVGTPVEQGPVPESEFEPAYTQEQFEERSGQKVPGPRRTKRLVLAPSIVVLPSRGCADPQRRERLGPGLDRRIRWCSGQILVANDPALREYRSASLSL